MPMLELRLQRKRGYELSNEIYLELPNSRKKVRLEKVEQKVLNNPDINGNKVKNLDEEAIKLTDIKIDNEGVKLSGKLDEDASSSSKVEVFRAKVIPDWVRQLKIQQTLATSNVTPVTDMDFKTDIAFKSNIYDDEYDSNQEFDYPENGCDFNCS